MPCPHYPKADNWCAICAREKINRMESALREILNRARNSEEYPGDLLRAIVEIARKAVKG